MRAKVEDRYMIVDHTRVGMARCMETTPMPSMSRPHTGGDGPYFDCLDGKIVSVYPRCGDGSGFVPARKKGPCVDPTLVGMALRSAQPTIRARNVCSTKVGIARRSLLSSQSQMVGPTQVGMARTRMTGPLKRLPFTSRGWEWLVMLCYPEERSLRRPRASGDSSVRKCGGVYPGLGWMARTESFPYHLFLVVYPTQVGMARQHIYRLHFLLRLPHASGDGPTGAARIGLAYRSLPHGRGDGPYSKESDGKKEDAFTPREWGWLEFEKS